MTRETKIGMVVASSFLALVGVVVANKLRKPADANPDQAQQWITPKDPKDGKDVKVADAGTPDSKKPSTLPATFLTNEKPPIDLPPLPGNNPGPMGGLPPLPTGKDGLPSFPPPASAEDAKKLQDLTLLAEAAKKKDGLPPLPNGDGFSPLPKDGGLPPLPPVAADKKDLAPPPGLPGTDVPPLPPLSGGKDPLPPLPPVTGKDPAPPVGLPPVGLPTPPTGTAGKDPLPPSGLPAPPLPPIGSGSDPVPPLPPLGSGNKDPLPPLPPVGTGPKDPLPPLGSNPPLPPLGSGFKDPLPPLGSSTPPLPPLGSKDPLPPLGPSPKDAPPLGTPSDPTTPNVPRVTSFDFMTYKCLPEDTSFDVLSARHYKTAKYAKALELYNRDHPFAKEYLRSTPVRLYPGGEVYIPAASVLDSKYAAAIGDAPIPPGPVGGGQPVVGLPTVGIPTPLVPNGGQPSNPPANPSDNGRAYQVPPGAGQMLFEIAQQQLGNPVRWVEIYRLNPQVRPEQPIPPGTTLRIPGR